MWKFDFCELLLFSTDSFGDWVGRCSSFIFLGCVLKISLTPQCSHLQTPLLEPDGQYGLAFKHGEQWHPASCDGSSQEFVGFKRGKLASRKRPFTLLTPPSGVSSVRFRAARMWRFWEISLLLPVRQTDVKTFYRPSVRLSQLISVWGPAYFLITGLSCFLASCLFAVPFDFITQR